MKIKIIILACLVSIAIVGMGVGYFIFRPSPIISREIQKKAGFTIFVMSKEVASTWRLDPASNNYDKEIGVLYTNLYKPNKSNRIVMTQQVLPDPFNDIPNYSSIFYSKLHAYKELNLPIGKVTLTHPEELKGGQSAVAVVKGTLMFLHPDKDLTDDDWKIVFKNLESL